MGVTMNISRRAKKLIGLAQIVPYTTEELIILRGIIESEWERKLGFENLGYQFDHSTFLDGINDYIEHGGYEIDWGEPVYWLGYEVTGQRKLNLMQFILVYFPKVFIFLTVVNKKDVPLFLCRGYLKMFAQWRLLINC
jgi:hypothetical protein